MLELSKELNIKTVITNDAHYLGKSDADVHDTMMCVVYDWEKSIRLGKTQQLILLG